MVARATLSSRSGSAWPRDSAPAPHRPKGTALWPLSNREYRPQRPLLSPIHEPVARAVPRKPRESIRPKLGLATIRPTRRHHPWQKVAQSEKEIACSTRVRRDRAPPGHTYSAYSSAAPTVTVLAQPLLIHRTGVGGGAQGYYRVSLWQQRAAGPRTRSCRKRGGA